MADTTQRPRRYAPWYNVSPANLPLPGLVSIFHRVSGALLFLFLVVLLYLLDRSLGSAAGFDDVRATLAHPFAKLVMLVLLWSYCHHFCAGIRYLFLDMHKGIDLATARTTSIAVFAVSIVLTVILAAILIW
jgi:succinate dehydrogenase / fumarate reductase, cytochrome b subunit